MKKKLLLSSVAALTLFAAYTTATAEEAKFGNFGERLKGLEQLPDAFKIEKAETAEEIEAATVKYLARQSRAFDLRVANDALNAAKELEANAKTNFEKAQKAFDEATQKVADAVNTQYDAQEQNNKLKEVLASVKNRLAYDTTQLNETNSILPSYESKQAQAAEALEKAQNSVNEHRSLKPVSGAPADVLKEYNQEHVARERNLEQAKATKKLVDEAVSKLKNDQKELTAAIEKANDRIKSLDDAIKRLDDVLLKGGSGEVRGVLVSELEKELSLRHEELSKYSEDRIHSTTVRKDAQKTYDAALEAAKAEFKAQGVEFVLEDVLAIEKPTSTYYTKFGWSKDAQGNWNYLLDSNGKKAVSQWVNDNGSWYYLGQDGVMKKWWVQVEGTWYYLNGSGAMQTGWLNDNGTWYYLEASGAMKANQWFEVDGKWYHVDASGALSVNTTVDGYNVNENGEWV